MKSVIINPGKFFLEICNHWQNVWRAINEIDRNIECYPKDPRNIFDISQVHNNNYEVSVRINPTALKFPMDADSSKKIIIVVGGNIRFEKINDGTSTWLRTINYQTRVEIYQIRKGEPLQHIFGARYEYDNSFDHPMFHAHITDEMRMAESIKNELGKVKVEEKTLSSPYGSISDLALESEISSKIKGVLGNVKIPTAQMDVFSVLIQLCADHLLSEKNREIKKRSFMKLIKACRFFQGIENNFHNQKEVIENTVCLRSGRWYNV